MVRTAKQKAAQLKASRASAAKRRGRGKSTRSSRKVIRKNRKAYAKKNYKGRGGYARKYSDLKRSKGAFATNRHGKPVGKATRALNKYAAYSTVSPLGFAVSKHRGKKRPKSRRR